MKPTAILLLHCPDKPGIISEITRFITDNKGNIVYLDQYVDRQDGMFFMRIEWELDSFLIPRDKIREYIATLYAKRYGITFNLYFNDEKVGHVTSGGVAPTAGKNIALAYVKNLPEICTDSTVQVMIREKLHDAKVVKRPFVQKRNRV